MIDLKTICMQVVELAKEAGEYIASERANFNASSIEVKGDNNFVSFVDKAAEELIIEKLSLLLPESGFIAEEGTNSTKGEKYNWIIDPLDGTTNFIHGLPPYSVSIGLYDGANVVLGVVYEITLKECFYSWTGAPSYMNGKEIHVSNVTKVKDSLVATGFPYTDYSMIKQALHLLEELFIHSHGVRRLGSAAADMVYVACGRCDVFYEYGLQPWDVAGAEIIVRNAGGKITDYDNKNDYIFGKRIIASNGLIHEEFQKLIAVFFK